MRSAPSRRRPLVGVTVDFLTVGERIKFTVYDRYVSALKAAGARVLLLPPDPEEIAEQIDLVGGVLLPGGDDLDPALWGCAPPPDHVPSNPSRTAYELELVRACIELDTPLLGVCLGAQVLNVACGGSLRCELPGEAIRHHDPGLRLGLRHEVEVVAGTRLAEALGMPSGGSVLVNSSHQRAPDRLGEGIVVAGRAPDGVIEAVERPDGRFCVGVQWHPEASADEESSRRLFAAFVAACGAAEPPGGKR